MAEWRYNSTILELGARWRRVASLTPLSLYPLGTSSRYPWHRRLGGPQSSSGRWGVEKNLESNTGHPALSPSLHRLSYPTPKRERTKLKNRERKIETKKHDCTKKQKCIHVSRFCKSEHPILTCVLGRKYCHVYECDYRRGLDWWPDLLHPLIQRVTTLYKSLLHTHTSVHSHVFTSRCSVAVSTAEVPLPLGSRTVPGLSYPLLTATAHNDWTSAIFWLTQSLTNQLFTSLNSTPLIN
jgi:hypothetical protein